MSSAADEWRGDDRTAYLAVWWGLSTLFHVLNVGGSIRMFSEPTGRSWWYAVLTVSALAMLVLPARAWRSGALCMGVLSVMVLITAWIESPVVGNHWLVSSLVSLGFLFAVVHAAATRRAQPRATLEQLFFPVARGVFFVFYSFSALAKVNRAFLDPVVSCANFFADETLRSLGIDSPQTVGTGSWRQLLPIIVVLVEIGVVVLLVQRRTRVWGVLLAVLFHGLIALDGDHPFADFTSLVYALLILFLPDDFFVWVRSRLGGASQRVSLGVRWVLAAAMVALVLVHGLLLGNSWWDVGDDLKDSVWRCIGAVTAAVIIAYVWSLRRSRAQQVAGHEPAESRAGSVLAFRAPVVPGARWLLVVPLLAFLNGITPYVGVKTANSWNMYSNLVTADGLENSLLVPTVWRWTDRQDDLVRIVASSDPVLAAYARESYLIPYTNLREYASHSPAFSLTMVRRGDDGQNQLVTITDSRTDPELTTPLSGWERRVFAYRYVDSLEPARCQPGYLPAR